MFAYKRMCSVYVVPTYTLVLHHLISILLYVEYTYGRVNYNIRGKKVDTISILAKFKGMVSDSR